MTPSSFEFIVGMPYEDACKAVNFLNYYLRIMRRFTDGKEDLCIGTCDVILNRVDVEVIDGIVTKIL